MKKLLVLLCLCVAAPSFAQDKPASAESIRELLTLSKSQQLIDGVYGQLDGLMQQAVRDTLAGKELTAEQDAIMTEMRGKMIAVLREEMSWEILEPKFVDIYQKTLTQPEVDGIVAFYKTDAGRALIDKMPQVMQHTMEMMMTLMQKISPPIKAVTDEMVEKLQAAN